MIDGAAAAVLIGSAVQAAPAAGRLFAALAPRAAAFVNELRATPQPSPDPDLDQLLASID